MKLRISLRISTRSRLASLASVPAQLRTGHARLAALLSKPRRPRGSLLKPLDGKIEQNRRTARTVERLLADAIQYWIDDVVVTLPQAIHAESPSTQPVLRLYPPRPNPFNPAATIRYTLPSSGHAELRAFDLSGRLVDVLISGRVEKVTLLK